jgi:hypothetical protein
LEAFNVTGDPGSHFRCYDYMDEARD